MRLPFHASGIGLLLLVVLVGQGCGRGLDVVAGVTAVTPVELRAMLDEEPLVLDLRDETSYTQGHLPGAVLTTFGDLPGVIEASDTGRAVVAVCYRGNQSREAAAIAEGFDRGPVYHLAGGMEAWRAADAKVETGPGRRALAVALPHVRSSMLAQSLVTMATLVVKPTYMIASLLLIVWLRRSRDRDLVLIRRAMVAFLAGEVSCALAYAFPQACDPLEIVHGAGMVVMGALLAWGTFTLVDRRILALSDPAARCQIQRLCRRCWKRDPVVCGVHRIFEFAALALVPLALMPWAAPLRPRTISFDLFFRVVEWGRGFGQLVVEQRIYPGLAALLFAVTALILLVGDSRSIRRAEAPFFAGIGLLLFSTMRFVLNRAFVEMPPWSDVWEEFTELFTVFGLALSLWTFRTQLGLGSTAAIEED